MSRQPPKASSYENGYTAENDELLAQHPPQITWRKNNRGIWIAVSVSESPRVQTTPTPRTPRSARNPRCSHGHQLTEDNVYVTPAGYRKCRTCKADQQEARRSRARQMAAIASALQAVREI